MNCQQRCREPISVHSAKSAKRRGKKTKPILWLGATAICCFWMFSPRRTVHLILACIMLKPGEFRLPALDKLSFPLHLVVRRSGSTSRDALFARAIHEVTGSRCFTFLCYLEITTAFRESKFEKIWTYYYNLFPLQTNSPPHLDDLQAVSGSK